MAMNSIHGALVPCDAGLAADFLGKIRDHATVLGNVLVQNLACEIQERVSLDCVAKYLQLLFDGSSLGAYRLFLGESSKACVTLISYFDFNV